jgi:hypothetical protein
MMKIKFELTTRQASGDPPSPKQASVEKMTKMMKK